MNLSQEKDNESKGDSCSRNFAPRGCGGYSFRGRGSEANPVEITREIL